MLHLQLLLSYTIPTATITFHVHVSKLFTFTFHVHFQVSIYRAAGHGYYGNSLRQIYLVATPYAMQYSQACRKILVYEPDSTIGAAGNIFDWTLARRSCCRFESRTRAGCLHAVGEKRVGAHDLCTLTLVCTHAALQTFTQCQLRVSNCVELLVKSSL